MIAGCGRDDVVRVEVPVADDALLPRPRHTGARAQPGNAVLCARQSASPGHSGRRGTVRERGPVRRRPNLRVPGIVRLRCRQCQAVQHAQQPTSLRRGPVAHGRLGRRRELRPFVDADVVAPDPGDRLVGRREHRRRQRDPGGRGGQLDTDIGGARLHRTPGKLPLDRPGPADGLEAPDLAHRPAGHELCSAPQLAKIEPPGQLGPALRSGIHVATLGQGSADPGSVTPSSGSSGERRSAVGSPPGYSWRTLSATAIAISTCWRRLAV